MTQPTLPTEKHPLEPFLPNGAKVLMLGSFPPGRERWSMEFFYPNRQNDMWRVMGLIYFGDKDYFYITEQNRFDRERIIEFCIEKGFAIYDTACEVRRLQNNASDKFLEVITPTDITSLLDRIPECCAIVSTGQKATEIIVEQFGCQPPKIGSFTTITLGQRELRFWRMPSTSRAYPLALEKKAEFYMNMFKSEDFRIS